MVRIPSEYQEVEYLESTGMQYIDLDFGFDPTDEVELRGAMTHAFQDKWLIAPKHWNTDNNRFSMLGGMGSFMFTFGQQGTPNNILSPAMEGDNNFHTVTYANKIFTVVDTGSIADMTIKSFGSTTANIRLFYGYANNTHGKIASYHHKKADDTEINLIPCYRVSDNEPGMYDTVTKQFYTNSGRGTFLKGNDVTYDNINLLESRRRILLNTPHIETVSDTIASFKTDVATKLKGCKIHFTPIQEGEGDPSPDNVRPIHGWDGVEVTACGKNLCPLINDTNYWSKKAWFDSDGVTHGSTRYVMCDYKKIPKNGTYFLSSIGRSWKGIGFYDESYNPLKFNQMNMKTISLTTVEGAVYYRVYAQTGASSANIQFELGSIATPYEPYTETTLTIPFNRTIYGGYVDLVRGEVVETNVKTTFGTGWNLANNNNKNGVFAKNIIARKATLIGTPSNIVCSAYSTQNTMPITTAVNNPDFSIYGRSTYSIIFVKDTRYETAEDFMENMSETEFTYELATPNVYQLTPQTLKALHGMNNIWSDANGDVEVSYYTH